MEATVSDIGDASAPPSDGEDIGVRIVRSVAAALEADPMELEPLSELVDIDALAALASSNSVDVSFEYEGLEVFVRRDGSVDVRPTAESESTDLR
jgi:hypothetical protein